MSAIVVLLKALAVVLLLFTLLLAVMDFVSS